MTSEFSIAVHALVYLNHKATTLSSDALAENVCTNPALVRKVMGKLKKAGLVATREGAEGGYLYHPSLDGLTLRQIGDAVGARYVGVHWRSGDVDKPCLVASGMGGILDGIYERLNEACRRELADITIHVIDRCIFGGGKETNCRNT